MKGKKTNNNDKYASHKNRNYIVYRECRPRKTNVCIRNKRKKKKKKYNNSHLSADHWHNTKPHQLWFVTTFTFCLSIWVIKFTKKRPYKYWEHKIYFFISMQLIKWTYLDLCRMSRHATMTTCTESVRCKSQRARITGGGSGGRDEHRSISESKDKYKTRNKQTEEKKSKTFKQRKKYGRKYNNHVITLIFGPSL